MRSISVFKKKPTKRQVGVLLALLTYTGFALAQDSMPWDGPLCGLQSSLRGPAALAISTIAFFAAGATFLWGEEIAGVSKKLTTIVMAVSILIGGASLVGWIAVKMGAGSTQCSSSY